MTQLVWFNLVTFGTLIAFNHLKEIHVILKNWLLLPATRSRICFKFFMIQCIKWKPFTNTFEFTDNLPLCRPYLKFTRKLNLGLLVRALDYMYTVHVVILEVACLKGKEIGFIFISPCVFCHCRIWNQSHQRDK